MFFLGRGRGVAADNALQFKSSGGVFQGGTAAMPPVKFLTNRRRGIRSSAGFLRIFCGVRLNIPPANAIVYSEFPKYGSRRGAPAGSHRASPPTPERGIQIVTAKT
jgi:hypothetical protein